MVQWVKVLAAKPHSLNPIPRTHTVVRANVPTLSSDLYTHTAIPVSPHTFMHTKWMIRI